MRLPAIVLNFKTYPEILGKRGWELAKRFAAVEDDTGASIVLAPPMTDLAHIAKLVHIPVIGQHVDALEPGQTTGWTPPEALLEAGAAGTLINHSERKVAWEEMAKVIPRCRQLGLEVIACADEPSEAETLAKLSPEYIAIEPPELIGGDVSVTTARPEVVSGAVGPAFASEFLAYRKVEAALVPIEQILAKPDKVKVPEERDVLYAVGAGLAAKLDEHNLDKGVTYLERIPAEFAVMVMKDVVAKIPDVQKVPAFVRWARANAKLLGV